MHYFFRLLLIVLLLRTTATSGQSSNPLQELSSSLSTLASSRIPTGVLMDRVVPLSNPHRFPGTNNQDTLTNAQGWLQQYFEYYYASLSAANLPPPAQVLTTIRNKVAQGVVPLLMLNYNYNELKPDAAQQQLITIDSVNAQVYDGPNTSQSPYTSRKLVSIALAQPQAQSTLQVYIGPEFWFGNQPMPASIWIYDGTTSQQVTMGSTIQVTVSPQYPYLLAILGPGTIFTHNNDIALTGYLPADGAQRTTLSEEPDVALGLLASRAWPGFTNSGPYAVQQGNAKAIAWIKYAASNQTGKLRRPLIFVEGIDFDLIAGGELGPANYAVQQTGSIPISTFQQRTGGFRNGTAGWNEMVEYNKEYKVLEKLPALRQTMQAASASGGGDFDVIYLDYSDGATLIQHNAMVLVELLEWINNPVNRAPNAEEAIVVGASMGGQVARFALAWMEQQGICHNSKLYVSFDSPHRGANIPLGIQAMFDRLQHIAVASGAARDVVNQQLRRPAAMQMLVTHFDDAAAAPFRNQWQAWQASADSYPSLLRKIAVANGSGQAVTQENMMPGMELLHTSGKGFLTGANYAFALPGSSYRSQNNVVFRWRRAFSLINNWHYVKANPSLGHYDTAPGSSYRTGGIAREQSDVLKAAIDYNTFMPTISTLDVRQAGSVLSPNFTYNIQNNIDPTKPNPSLYAFDAYVAPQFSNEPHIQITNGQASGVPGNPSYLSNNSAWIQNELRESKHDMPSVLTTTYNYGSIYRHLLPSVQVTSGGKLYVNNNSLPVNGGTPATQGNPPAGNFEVYTSNCATVVQVTNGGQAVIGASAPWTASLQMARNSLFDVQAGGQVDVNAGSVLRIKPGATLVVRNGATLTIHGQVIIEEGGYLCTESSANVQVTASGQLSIAPYAIAGTNPALNLGNLACTGQPTPSPLSVSLDGPYYQSTDFASWQALPTGGTGTYNYTWYLDRNNGQGFVQQATNSAYFSTYFGYATVTVRVDVTSGTQSAAAYSSASPGGGRAYAYPNPADSELEFAPDPSTRQKDNASLPVQATTFWTSTSATKSTTEEYEVKLYDKQGLLRREGVTKNTKLKFNVKNLPEGIYHLRATRGKEKILEQIIIKH